MRKIVNGWMHRIPAALIIIAGFIVAVYFPGLHGPFIFDDQNQIINNPSIAITDLTSSQLLDALTPSRSEVLGRPLAKLSFALSHYLAGGTVNTLPYKLIGLIIHVINAWLVFWLCALLLRESRPSLVETPSRIVSLLPLIATLAWAIHPLNLTSVLYVSQRSTLFSAMFMLAGILIFTYGRIRVARGNSNGYLMMLTGLIGGIGLGMTGKENAILLPAYVLVLEFVLFREIGWRRGLAWFYGLTLAIPGTIIAIWILMNPQVILENYLWRHFSLGERLLTETRVLWFYASLVIVPDFWRLGLFHDDIEISRSLIDPWTTLPAALGLLMITAIALVRARKYPAASFAVLWFLAGHLLESGVIGLEIAHEHRNYLPSLGPVLAMSIGLSALLRRRSRFVTVLLPAGLIAVLGFVTFARAHVWADQEKIIQHMAANQPSSPSAHAMLAQLALAKHGDLATALTEYRRAADLAPYEAGHLIMMAVITAENKAVFMVPSESGDMAAGPKPGKSIKPEASILEEIHQRLESSPAGSVTGAALERLYNCLTQEPHHCRSLRANAELWYRQVLKNRRVNPGIHGDVVIYLADLYMLQNRFEEALQIAETWSRRKPSNLNYRLIAADAHLHMGHLDAAEQAILLIKSSPGGAEYREATDFLLDKLSERRKRQNLKRSGIPG